VNRAALLVCLLAGAAPTLAAPTVYHQSPPAVAAGLPFSEATEVGGILYLSGQLGARPGELKLVPGGLEAETRQIFTNIGNTLKARGLSFDDVFKCTVMLADMADWPAFNLVYVTYFKPDRLPSRSAMGVGGLALGARVEMECWANTSR
jgi:reactive intermediate/imine deaminase